jgi:hypothetical protein
MYITNYQYLSALLSVTLMGVALGATMASLRIR